MHPEYRCSRRELLTLGKDAFVAAGAVFVGSQLTPFLELARAESPGKTLRLALPMYHDIEPVTLLRDDLIKCLDVGWQLATPAEVNNIFTGRLEIPESLLILPTLDDGFASQPEALRLAHEELSGKRSLRWGAIWSVIMGFDRLYDVYGKTLAEIPDDTPCYRVGELGPKDFAWKYSDKKSILDTLALNHDIELGIHGVTHISLAGLKEEVMRQEIGGAVRLIEEFYRFLGREWKVRSISFVNGSYDKKVIDISKEFGCTLGFRKISTAEQNIYLPITDHLRVHTIDNPFIIPRTGRK